MTVILPSLGCLLCEHDCSLFFLPPGIVESTFCFSLSLSPLPPFIALLPPYLYISHDPPPKKKKKKKNAPALKLKKKKKGKKEEKRKKKKEKKGEEAEEEERDGWGYNRQN